MSFITKLCLNFWINLWIKKFDKKWCHSYGQCCHPVETTFEQIVEELNEVRDQRAYENISWVCECVVEDPKMLLSRRSQHFGLSATTTW